MEDFFKKTGVVSIITSLIFAAVGIVLMWNPEEFLTVICYILGTLFLIVGVVKTVSYFMAKGNYNIYNYDLALGIIAIVAGVVVIFGSSTILSIIAIIIGIWIIYSGLVRLGYSLKLRKVKNDLWIPVTVIAAIMIVSGLYMIMNNAAVYSAIGLIMLLYAVLDLVEGIIYMKTVKEIFK